MTTTETLKAVSVLRDDISSLSDSIAAKYHRKITYLTALLRLNTEIRSLIISNETETMQDRIVQETDYIEKINIIDFEMSDEISQMMRKFGRNFTEFKSTLNEFRNEKFSEILRLSEESKNLLVLLNRKKDEIILALDGETCRIRKDIDEINRIRQLYSIYPEIMDI